MLRSISVVRVPTRASLRTAARPPNPAPGGRVGAGAWRAWEPAPGRAWVSAPGGSRRRRRGGVVPPARDRGSWAERRRAASCGPGLARRGEEPTMDEAALVVGDADDG